MRLFHSLQHARLLKRSFTTNTFNLARDSEFKPITPISYFGQRESLTSDLFHLLGNRKYNNFYDPFSGSGSISFAAMKNKIAKRYVINDSLPVFQQLWEEILSDPKKITIPYKRLVKHYIQLSFEEKHRFYLGLLKKFNHRKGVLNQLEIVTYFAFCLNFSENNIPIFDKTNALVLKPNLIVNKEFEEKRLCNFEEIVFNLFDLLKSNSVFFNSGDFTKTLLTASTGDLVVFDPPYPEQDSRIYFNLKNEVILQHSLQSSFDELNKKNIDFCILYGAGPVKEKNQFNDKKLALQHLIRLSSHPFFGNFLEHIYVSGNIPLNAVQLPPSIVFFNDLFKVNGEISIQEYEHAMDRLKSKNEDVSRLSLPS